MPSNTENPNASPDSGDDSARREETGAHRGRSAEVVWLGRIVSLLLTVALLAGGGGVAFYWMKNKPTAQRQRPQARPALVSVDRVARASERVRVRALGDVVPAAQIQLASRVGGRIVEVSPEFAPGGRFAAGEQILRVDPADYDLVVRQRASDLAKAESDLNLEMGQQSVSQREYELLGQTVREEDKELLLRGPQEAIARATVATAKAALEKARLDLSRTKVVAPFNATVQSRSVDLGSEIGAGAVLASLVCTDAYWAQVSVPLDQLKWINIPGLGGRSEGEGEGEKTGGAAASIFHESAWGEDACRLGVVERLMTDLEPEGRMARLLVAIDDPLDLAHASGRVNGRPARPLILGAYVRAEIEGRALADVVRIPRTALRDSPDPRARRVWVMRPDRTLEIRDVKIAWSSNEHVCVSEGLEDGDLLVTSDLGAPVEGMALRTAAEGGPGPEGGAVPPPGAGKAEKPSQKEKQT